LVFALLTLQRRTQVRQSQEKNVGSEKWRLPFGANVVGDAVYFRVWAPGSDRVSVQIGTSDLVSHQLKPEPDGWFSGSVEGVSAGARYKYQLSDGNSYPDPASRYQPDGVHGASCVIDASTYKWRDAEWRGLDIDDLVIYELHVGTATDAGTFDSLHDILDHVRALGATAVEIMPVAQFAGNRNWGYDGVFPYAPAAAYGDPDSFRRLVDAAHARGLGVILDVVYNHLGPEGNYLPAITGNRIFTEKHKTPWGAGINYDDEGSAAVREYFIQNALYWIHEFHVDGLRCDATHAIHDDSSTHVLSELTQRARTSTEKPVIFIAEDERNDRIVVTPAIMEGLGFDSVWADDFHHQVRRHTAGDSEGYFSAYSGTTEDIARTLQQGWFYTGQVYPPSKHERGTDPDGLPLRSFVLCIQNHDQVGNRALGERLNHQIEPAVYRAASALLLLAPHTPMLWMGQEWSATSPFQYFTDHPEALGKLVTEGRREEFKHFSAFADPNVREKIPDPQSPDTYYRSKLKWQELGQSPHREMFAYYEALIALRRSEPAFRNNAREHFHAEAVSEHALLLVRHGDVGHVLVIISFGGELTVELGERSSPDERRGGWSIAFQSERPEFGGDADWCELKHERLALHGAGAVVLKQI
jgi:maltooligosyltrehalose trehalohydrolase